MKSIQKAFELVSGKNPNWGDYICLCECIKRKGYTDAIIRKAFKKFIKDCTPLGREREQYIKYLILKTKK